MIIIQIIYFLLAFTALASLAGVIHRIGGALQGCPQAGQAARLGAVIVTSAFISIGAGVIAIVGASLPLLVESGMTGLYVAIGCVCIALGVGFTAASRVLRDITQAAMRQPEAAEA